jgi:hypothetical protein
MTRVLAGILVILGVVSVPLASAQNARTGRLTITVADQTGAVIPGATVSVTSQDNPGRTANAPETTSPQGVAVFQGLPPGRFTVLVDFPGFEPRLVRDLRVREGDNRQSVALAIQKVEDTVTVSQDPSSAASDRRGSSFGTVLTREQIDALSEDPEEMRRQLADMAGLGAVIKVDSFEGAQLPPKSQIRMIRISRDQFAAENHFAGGLQIDIVTQPGLGPIRGQVGTRLQDGSMTGRSPFVPKKGPERSTTYNLNLSGSLVRERTSFSMSVNGLNAFETPNLKVATLTGQRSEALTVRRPRNQMGVNVNVDHALTKDQTLRFGLNRNANSQRNLGIGDYNLPERAYQTENATYSMRAQHVGPLGRRFFTNSRVQIGWTDSATRSALESPTIRVLDAFTSGGQQLAGGNHNRTVNLASDLDYVRGRHSVRTGIVVDGVWHRSDSTSNYLGTYTFESLAAFEENRPRSYTRRIGDPNIDYLNMQGALYLQDDIRLRPNLTLSPGVRYEVQTHLSDFNNLGPRIGVTWAPGRNGRTSYRASAGIFYDWLGTGTYEQTLRVDGFQQRELNIPSPSFPDPGDTGFVPPLNRYLLGDAVRMPRQLRFSGGVDRSLTRSSRVGFTYAHLRGTSLQRGLNLNAPIDGVRPFPEFGNIVEVVSDAGSRSDNVTVFFNASLTRPATPPAPSAPGAAPAPFVPPAQRFVDWRRASITTQYTVGRFRNNTDGDFSVSPTGSLEQDWGTAGGDVRHRVIVQYSTQIVRNMTTSLLLNMSTGAPYTLQTGRDDNGDLIFNDRPAGVARNTERASGQMSLNANFNYGFTFGRAAVNTPPGIGITSVGGVITATTIAAPQQGRYRVSFFVQAQNLTNRSNFVGYSGVMTSPFFRIPTNVSNPRRVDMGMNFGF